MRHVIFVALVAFAGCIQEEPVRKPLPAPQHRAAEERRSHALKVPGPVGSLEGTSFYIDLQADRPEAEVKRAVLVEVDPKGRAIGHAYLTANPTKGFVDLDVVVVATPDTVTCYDCARHELRWEVSYADRGFEIDELVRRGRKLDVIFAGKMTETLDLVTGRRSLP